VIITKPGGLTITESLAMELPMIFIGAIYGQETKNAAILEECRAGMSPAGLISIRDVVLGYKNNPGKLKQIRKEMGKIKKPFASREICAHFLPK
jgi:processive 1,2-diacylglycerol beta-glucosyltransferase